MTALKSADRVGTPRDVIASPSLHIFIYWLLKTPLFSVSDFFDSYVWLLTAWRLFLVVSALKVSRLISGERIMTKGRIAVLSISSRRRMESSDLDPYLTMVPWARPTLVSPPKRHLDRFTHPFLHSSPVCPTRRHTYRHADHATCDICRNRPRLYYACDAA